MSKIIREHYKQKSADNIILSVYIRKNNIRQNLILSDNSINDIISYIGGLISVAMLFLKICVSNYNEYRFYKYTKEKLFSKETNDTKNDSFFTEYKKIKEDICGRLDIFKLHNIVVLFFDYLLEKNKKTSKDNNTIVGSLKDINKNNNNSMSPKNINIVYIPEFNNNNNDNNNNDNDNNNNNNNNIDNNDNNDNNNNNDNNECIEIHKHIGDKKKTL